MSMYGECSLCLPVVPTYQYIRFSALGEPSVTLDSLQLPAAHKSLSDGSTPLTCTWLHAYDLHRTGPYVGLTVREKTEET